jgi:hypothetical protein
MKYESTRAAAIRDAHAGPLRRPGVRVTYGIRLKNY